MLAGDWSNQGSFSAGSGIVSFVDVSTCAAASAISGNTAFNRLSFVSTVGKRYRFAAASVQTVAGSLTMTGTSANPLRIESATPGNTAFINLIGAQTMANLAVRDMSATGQWVAVGLTNQAAGGVTVNWFGFPIVPVDSPLLLQLMVLALLASGFYLIQQRKLRAALNTHKGKQR